MKYLWFMISDSIICFLLNIRISFFLHLDEISQSSSLSSSSSIISSCCYYQTAIFHPSHCSIGLSRGWLHHLVGFWSDGYEWPCGRSVWGCTVFDASSVQKVRNCVFYSVLVIVTYWLWKWGFEYIVWLWIVRILRQCGT